MPNIQALRQKLETLPEFCNCQLWPEVEKFEQENQVDRSGLDEVKRTWGPWLMGALAVGFFGGYLNLAGEYSPWVFLGSALVGGFAFLKMRPELQKWAQQSRKRREAEIVLVSWMRDQLMDFLDPSFRFEAQPAFPRELYISCGLFHPSYDRGDIYGAFSGLISQTQFRLSEIGTFRKQTSKDSRGRTQTTWTPIYRGLLFKADFNKNFNSHTLVQVDRAEGRLGFIARGLQRLKSSRTELQLVEMENPDFEKVFKVTSTNPIEARYKLTPAFMEHFLKLRDKYGDGIELVFLDQLAVISIPHKKSFLPLYFNVKELTSSVQRAATELVDVLEIIEDLELDNRTWNKTPLQRGA